MKLHGKLPPQALVETLFELFNDLNEVLFWVKDSRHRIICLNETFAQRVKKTPDSILGRTDLDLYLPELARVFLADDEQVLKTGQPIRRKVELLNSSFGGVEWRSTTKLPVVGADHKVLGTAGISRPLPDSVEALPADYRAFGRLVHYAREHLAEGVSVQSVAREAGMSTATLERRFRAHLQMTPMAFLAQLRIARACELLRETPLNMTEISAQCGYESPAAFSRAFHQRIGIAPSHFRRQAESS